MIITKIRCRIDQSYKIKRDMLIRAGIGEPSRNKNIPNNKGEQRVVGYCCEIMDNRKLCDQN